MKSYYRPLLLLALSATLFACSPQGKEDPLSVQMTKEELLDKIKGGWAAQTIGVVFAAPTEFKFQGTTMQSYQPIPWGERYVKYWWDKKPGLFDDIYNDLTFVETFEQEGLNCHPDTLAKRFAFAEYHLAHANQMGRYNIRRGIMPPQSGSWLNNPHADDLDFQIESDFIGLMSPGMISQGLQIAEKVGHIMNSGDGFYGGAFVTGLYSKAFVSNDVKEILDAALSSIPKESTFYQCVDDVRKWHKQYPNDWEQAWFELHKKWNIDKGCPKGVFLSFNIDAKLNSAYVALALLYGNGNFAKSLEIAARAGQDSDCNAATVAGVLGVIIGYNQLESFWLNPLKEIEPLCFEGTQVSLERAYALSFKHALELISLNGGKVEETTVEIPIQKGYLLPLEENFTDTYPLFRERKDCFMENNLYTFDFQGNGFVIYGNLVSTQSITKDYIHRVAIRFGSEPFALAELNDNYEAQFEVWIDGVLDHTSVMPMRNTSRKLEPAWKYLLPEGKHTIALKWLNPHPTYCLRINDIMYYSSQPLPSPYYMNPVEENALTTQIDGV